MIYISFSFALLPPPHVSKSILSITAPVSFSNDISKSRRDLLHLFFFSLIFPISFYSSILFQCANFDYLLPITTPQPAHFNFNFIFLFLAQFLRQYSQISYKPQPHKPIPYILFLIANLAHCKIKIAFKPIFKAIKRISFLADSQTSHAKRARNLPNTPPSLKLFMYIYINASTVCLT